MLPRSSHAGSSIALVAALGLSACTDAAEPRTESDLSESFRMGRVHVVLEPEADSETDDELQVTARFAFVRGLEEDFVRARLDMGLMPDEILKPSQCSADLYAGEPDEPTEDPRELVLVDAGELSVRLGDAQVQVPLSLVPDLLPYMSGVEYIYYGDGLPQAMEATLAVEAEGSATEELPAFAVEGAVPPDLGLTYTDEDAAEVREGALVLRWEPEGDTPITLTLTPLIDHEVAGEEITCVFDDVGQARLDLHELQTYGLPLAADSVRIVASRTSTTTFDAGEFQGSELVIERRDAVQYPLR